MAKKYEMNMVITNGVITKLVPTVAEQVKTKILPNYIFMLHRNESDPKTWTISEFGSGRAVCAGLPTRQAAIDKLNKVLESRSDDLVRIVKSFIEKDGYINEIWKEVK